MSFLLLDLEYVRMEVLTDWLDLDSLAKFDSAVCNKNARNAFITMIDSPNFSLWDTLHGKNDCVQYVKWISVRRLKFATFSLSDAYYTDGNFRFPLCASDRTTEVLITGGARKVGLENTLIDFINSLPKLISLKFWNAVYSISKITRRISPSILKNFTTFRLVNDEQKSPIKGLSFFTPAVYAYLATHCTKLQYLFIDYKKQPIYVNTSISPNAYDCEDVLITLINRNKKLAAVGISDLMLKLTFKVVEAFVTNCKEQIHCLELSLIENVSLAQLNYCHAMCPHLWMLALRNCQEAYSFSTITGKYVSVGGHNLFEFHSTEFTKFFDGKDLEVYATNEEFIDYLLLHDIAILDIRNYALLTTEDVINILIKVPKLLHFATQTCWGVEADKVYEFAKANKLTTNLKFAK